MSKSSPTIDHTLEADYVIVGAGSAGCVMASRLSEQTGTEVILIEAGGRRQPLIVQMPSAFYLPMRTKSLNWGYVAQPAKHLHSIAV